jgi:hypothetical protein
LISCRIKICRQNKSRQNRLSGIRRMYQLTNLRRDHTQLVIKTF